jgi:hypothetical protein
MKLQNKATGDILEVPPPDQLGAAVVRLNGRIVERCLYSDAAGGSVTLGDGRVFSTSAWPAYLIERLRTGWPEKSA